eukprot:SAG25_NODE_682_length_5948_cov_2.801334_4_plen_97_part_01
MNGFADTLPKPLCVYPHFTHGTSAMYRYGYGIRADDVDAFLMHSLKPRSMTNCGFVDPRTGEMCALTKMGLDAGIFYCSENSLQCYSEFAEPTAELI